MGMYSINLFGYPGYCHGKTMASLLINTLIKA